ncbi:WD40 repeat domain-containing protein [Rubinisphaera sp. JC750]|uniref:WD40 repeat domain-containing protein n=1 Tax=Rubinisphaera sp. JC750 TaxID=2898658 RepID=UPI001F3ABF68|nr:hypothetical protein [Rubinisphaera sp. JC750]
MPGTQITCSGCDRTLTLKPGKQLTSKSLCPTCGTPLLADSYSTGRWQRDDEMEVEYRREPVLLSPEAKRIAKRVGAFLIAIAFIGLRTYLRHERREQNAERREAVAAEQHRQSNRDRFIEDHRNRVAQLENRPHNPGPHAEFGFPNPHKTMPSLIPENATVHNPPRGGHSDIMKWHREQHEKVMEKHRERFEAMRRSFPGHTQRFPSHNTPGKPSTFSAPSPQQPDLTESYGVKAIAMSANYVDGVQLHPHQPFVFTRSHSSQLKTFHLESDSPVHTCDINDAAGADASPGNRITTMAITPDGSKLLVGTYRGQVLVYQVEEEGALTYEQTYRGHNKPIDLIVASPYGQRVLSATASGSVRCWNVTTGQNDWELANVRAQVKAMHFIDDDNAWVCTGRFLGRWNLAKPGDRQEQEYLLDIISSSPSVTFSPAGDELAVTAMGYIKRFALGTGRMISQFNSDSSLYSLKYSYDGERLYAGIRGAINVYSRDNQLTAKVELIEADGYPVLLEPCRNRQAFLCIQSAHNSQTLFAELQ